MALNGLSTRERVLAELQELLDRHEIDPGGFAASPWGSPGIWRPVPERSW